MLKRNPNISIVKIPIPYLRRVKCLLNQITKRQHFISKNCHITLKSSFLAEISNLVNSLLKQNKIDSERRKILFS